MLASRPEIPLGHLAWRLVVLALVDEIFADGFESATAGQWSATQP